MIRSSSAVLTAAMLSAPLACWSLAQTPAPPATTTTTTAPQAAPAVATRMAITPADPRWLDRLPKDDRAALDDLLGWAPPPFETDLQWIGGEPTTWDSLRGRVVVLQSFTTATAGGRGWPQRVAGSLKEYEAKDVRILALHTPDDAAGAKEFLSRKPAPDNVTVVVDSRGAYCDALAIYKQPINIVVDRNGAVRYAGLNAGGLEDAVKALAAERFDPNVIVAQRGGGGDSAANPAAAGDFPPITGKVEYALDIRGQRAPEFSVSQWLTARPNAQGKVVLLDFWATWCGPCVASIPHMNELATRFKDDVVCVGISGEKPNDFEKGMARLEKDKKITLNTFKYPLALDPAATMSKAIQIKGIPHCVVMDRNWIVRWQGMPGALDAGTLSKIVQADKAQAGEAAGADGGTGKAKSAGASKRKKWVTGA